RRAGTSAGSRAAPLRGTRDAGRGAAAGTAAKMVGPADRALPAGGTDQQPRRTAPVHVSVRRALGARRSRLAAGVALRQGAGLDLFDLDQRLRLRAAHSAAGGLEVAAA